MKEHKLFVKFNHSEYGEVKTIDKMYFHPITKEEDVWFKVEVVGSKPTLYYYAKQSELK